MADAVLFLPPEIIKQPVEKLTLMQQRPNGDTNLIVGNIVVLMPLLHGIGEAHECQDEDLLRYGHRAVVVPINRSTVHRIHPAFFQKLIEEISYFRLRVFTHTPQLANQPFRVVPNHDLIGQTPFQFQLRERGTPVSVEVVTPIALMQPLDIVIIHYTHVERAFRFRFSAWP